MVGGSHFGLQPPLNENPASGVSIRFYVYEYYTFKSII